MIKYILGVICIALVAANDPPQGGSLEDLIHDIFTPPPDLTKGTNNGYNQPGVIGQPGAIGQPAPGPVQPGPVKPQQPPIEVNVSEACSLFLMWTYLLFTIKFYHSPVQKVNVFHTTNVQMDKL